MGLIHKKNQTNIRVLTILLFAITNPLFANEAADQCVRLFNDEDYSKAVRTCQKAAEQGDAAAQTVLGEMYDLGQGVEIDQKMVAKWWIKASDSSYLPAQNLLALKYYYGGDVFEPQPDWKQDYNKAYKIWKQSALKGVATSQYMLGEMYMHGQGVKADYSESYAWFKIALEGGYKLATDSLIELSRIISVDQKREGIERMKRLKILISNK